MVFSFFKKEPKKMVARPAAVPRAKPAHEDNPLFGGEDGYPPAAANPVAAAPAAAPAKEDGLSPLESSSFAFSEGSLDYQVEADIDPVDAEAEKAAMLFANGHDDMARGVLEAAVAVYRLGPAERLWLMLFDLYQLTGKRPPFEALGIEYARCYEKSPPGWRDKSPDKPKNKEVLAGTVLFRGPLVGDNQVAFDAIRQAVEKNAKIRLDLSSLAELDAPGCGRFLAQLQQARKAKREIEILGRDRLRTLLEKRVEAGRAEDQECWLLLLEIYQLQGQHEAFDEVAINYAVTFEVSPPSWEPRRIASPEPVLQLAVDDSDAGGAARTDAYVLRGEIKAQRFGDLAARTEQTDPVLIDCLALTRMDFISAGALLNTLTTVRRTGKQIVFRHPNHLVAELFGIVGLTAVATIVFAKR
jgi:anti-anti-sigma regulatory factor